jgi:hypothetical protein
MSDSRPISWSVTILLFANWQVFLHGQWNRAGFVTSYFGVPFFLVCVSSKSNSFSLNMRYLIDLLGAGNVGCISGINGFSKRGLFLVRCIISFRVELLPMNYVVSSE